MVIQRSTHASSTVVCLWHGHLFHQLLREGYAVKHAKLQSLFSLLGPHQYLHGFIKQALLHEVVRHPLGHLGAGAFMKVLGNLIQDLVVVVLEAEVKGMRDFTCLL